MATEKTSRMYDVLIIGSGMSGLASALTLARQQHTALVLDSAVYRNALSPHMYNVLTWDGEDPASFRAAAKKNILDYYTTIEFEDAEVASIDESQGPSYSYFTATFTNGDVRRGRKVILATGVRDIYPEIEGYAECFAKAM